MFKESSYDWESQMQDAVSLLREFGIGVHPPRNLKLHENQPKEISSNGRYLPFTDTIHVFDVKEKNNKVIEVDGLKLQMSSENSISKDIKRIIEHELIHRWQAFQDSPTPPEIKKVAPRIERQYHSFIGELIQIRENYGADFGIIEELDLHTGIFEWRDVLIASNTLLHKEKLNNLLKILGNPNSSQEEKQKAAKNIVSLLESRKAKNNGHIRKLRKYKDRLSHPSKPMEGMTQFWNAYREGVLRISYTENEDMKSGSTSFWASLKGIAYAGSTKEEVKEFVIEGYNIYSQYLDKNLRDRSELTEERGEKLEKKAVAKTLRYYKKQIRFN